MGLKNSQYQAIMRKYEQKQLRNHDILTQHYEEVYRQLLNLNHWMIPFPFCLFNMENAC